MNGLANFSNQEFWPAFWRATLIKLDVLAIFMSISVVTYFFVSWAIQAPQVVIASQPEVSVPTPAPVQQVRRPAAQQVQVKRNVAPQAKAPRARVQRQAPANNKRPAIAHSRRVSEKSRRN